MKKENSSLFKVNKQRTAVLQVIRQELYPEADYPVHLYPDLSTVLWDCFSRWLKDHPDRRSEQEDESTIAALAREVLVFRNVLSAFPQAPALLYRTYIKRFIRYQLSRTSTDPEEWEDIFQEVMTRLISGKLDRIRERFDFSYLGELKKSTFTSYLMVTIRNIYMDILRERKIRPLTSGEIHPIEEVLNSAKVEGEHMLNRLVLEEEFKKLRALLALHFRSRSRLELCLKLKCRIQPTLDDVRACFPSCTADDAGELCGDFTALKDKHLFDKVIDVFNRCEGRVNKSDTLRKWVSVKVDEMIDHLNHTHGAMVYTAANFIDFVMLYFDSLKSGAPLGRGVYDE